MGKLCFDRIENKINITVSILKDLLKITLKIEIG